MSFVFADRAKETSITVGVGTFTLSGVPVVGYRTLIAGVGNGNDCLYVIENPGTIEWETGLGRVSGSTLIRQFVLSGSNGGSLVNFSAGTKFVSVDLVAAAIPASMSVQISGAKGDGATNDLVSLQWAIDATSPGNTVVLVTGKIYKCTNGALAMKQGVSLDLNGSELWFSLTGDYEALQTRGNSCAVFNGKVTVTGSGLSGTGGNLHTPINVGQTYANIGYSDITLRNLTINGNRVDGNGILVSADSNNVRIENVTFPDSSTMGRPILIHWGGDGAIPPALTTHPHNIVVENIKVGTMTYSAGIAMAAVFISAAYNVQVRNVTVKRIYESVISVVTGDYGFERAAALVKPLASQGITVDGVTCEDARGYGVYVNSVADNQAGTPVITTPVIIRNVKTKGIGAGATKSGFRALEALDVIVENCEFTNHLRGFEIEASSKRIWIRGGRAYHNQEHGVYASHGSNPMDCIIEGVETYLNGQAGGNWAGIYVGGATRIVVRNNRVGHVTSETGQVYGIRTDSSVTALSILDNYVYNTKAAGTAYSLGSGGDNGRSMIWEFRGNGAGAAVPNFRAGVTELPVLRVVDGTNKTITVAYGGAVPTVGTWGVDDHIIRTSKAVGSPKGWFCTVAGTPGTWVSEGNL